MSNSSQLPPPAARSVTNKNSEIGKRPLFEGGQMGVEVSAKDWSRTPLGPIEQWPQSLRTTISLCLASNFPISIAWGRDRIQIYNDGYWQICGDKHPTAMGQDFKECWFTAWPVIGEAFESATAGHTKFLVNQRMFLDRNGYLEETFFTFSFSPIRGESGGVEGLFHPVTELTQQSLGDRRTTVLRNMATRTINAKTCMEVITHIMEVISESNLDIPFCLLYTLNTEGRTLKLQKSTGVDPDSALCPQEVDLANANAIVWPFREAIQGQSALKVENLDKVFGEFQSGPYDEPPHTALLFPILLPGLNDPYGVFVAGVSSRRALDEPYSTFFELVSSAITGALTRAKAFEDEQKKAEALLEIDKAKTAFFNNISHEFRTPLTLMLGPLEDTLNDTQDPLASNQRHRLQLVQRNALRLQRLVNSLLDFSRIEAGRLDARFSPTSLSSLTRELASAFHSAMLKANLEYIVDCHPLSQPVYVDRDMWEKIVLNLLSNALKFTFHGKIQVRIVEEKESVLLQVSDTGEGIAHDELHNLFKRFYRVKGAKSRTHEGSGIGLAFIHELIKIHGGSIEVDSELKKGTIFSVRIPFGTAHLPKDKIMDDDIAFKNGSQSQVFINESTQWLTNEITSSDVIIENVTDSRDVLILVVDDNADMREYITRVLSKNKRWQIQTANNGVQALEILKTQKPHLVLSDIMMPEMDGFELLKNIRENSDTQPLPVILLSARAGEEATLEGLERKANDYLVKPFSARELFSRINTHLELDSYRQNNIKLISTLENTNQQLLNMNKELDAFSYTVSHDLRAPLRSVIGYANVLEEDCAEKLTDSEKRTIRVIKQNASKMNQLIDDLLQFSRLGQKDLDRTQLNSTQIVNTILADLRDAIKKNVNIEVKPLADIYADGILINQVWINLISNAIKYSSKKENPYVEIGSEQMDKEVAFYVKDNGAGFDMAYADRLFGTFQRLHKGEEFHGTGLGLSIVKGIVTRHGGRVWAEGKVNEGATFHFSLPC